jgi:thiamine kinase-like enzyme
VKKVYRDDVDIASISKELRCLENGSLFDFAPSIRRVNIKERWYEEDYISGFLEYSPAPCESKTFLKKFYKDILPCLESLILHKFQITKNTIDYINEIKNNLLSRNLLSDNLDVLKIDKILSFIRLIEERIKAEGNLTIYLVLTHGDFCPANMLNTKHGLKVLDWESSTYRSALFDFYSYFFFRPLHQKLPLDNLPPEIEVALPRLINNLESKIPSISESLKSFEKVYRWFYYIERISMLVERVKYDTKLNTRENIIRYIDVFNNYEEICKYQNQNIYSVYQNY